MPPRPPASLTTAAAAAALSRSGPCRLASTVASPWLATQRRRRPLPTSTAAAAPPAGAWMWRRTLAFAPTDPHEPHNQPGHGQCCNNPDGCEHRPAEGYHPPGSHESHAHAHDAATPPCWNCGKPTGCCNFFCACGKIQPLIGHCSYFDTFHLPKAYDLDAKALEKTFFELQKTMHPDKYGQKSSTEQGFSRSNSTYLNVAYRTLKDPTLRAKYLLQLEGVRALDEASKTADPALLMEVMELRERVDESTSVPDLQALITENRRAIDAVKQELAELYRQKAWPRMVALTNRLQYLSKVEYEAREKLGLLEDDFGSGGQGKQQQQHA